MVNSKHSVTVKSTPKLDLCSSSRNITDSQATVRTLGTKEDENSFKETASKIYMKKG